MEGFEVLGLRLDLVILMWITIGGLVLVLVLFGLGILIDAKSAYSDGDAAFAVALFIGVVTAIVGIVWVCMFIPFKSVYHHWYGSTGTVDSVTNIFEGGSGEISPGYVVELDSVEEPLLFTDPRILRSQGEEVNVTCSVEWVPAGVDRLNCWIAK